MENLSLEDLKEIGIFGALSGQEVADLSKKE